MTVLVGYQEVVTYRPIFSTAFSCFTAYDVHDTITIKEIWAFLYLLLDIVKEAMSTKLLSGESSTKSASQHTEQILVGIGSSVKPLVELYGNICTSEMFSRLIGRLDVRNISVCTFTDMEEIVADEGGLYIYYLVKDFVSELFNGSTVIGRLLCVLD